MRAFSRRRMNSRTSGRKNVLLNRPSGAAARGSNSGNNFLVTFIKNDPKPQRAIQSGAPFSLFKISAANRVAAGFFDVMGNRSSRSGQFVRGARMATAHGRGFPAFGLAALGLAAPQIGVGDEDAGGSDLSCWPNSQPKMFLICSSPCVLNFARGRGSLITSTSRLWMAGYVKLKSPSLEAVFGNSGYEV